MSTPVTFLYEDADLAIVDKPAGVAVIPVPGVPPAECLRDRVAAALGSRAWVVHRIDRDASGVVVLARTAEAHRVLSLAFETRDVLTQYAALVHGVPAPAAGVIDVALRDARRGKVRPALPDEPGARPAATDYAVTRSWRDGERRIAEVAATPHTGQHHQVRVHLRSIGHAGPRRRRLRPGGGSRTRRRAGAAPRPARRRRSRSRIPLAAAASRPPRRGPVISPRSPPGWIRTGQRRPRRDQRHRAAARHRSPEPRQRGAVFALCRAGRACRRRGRAAAVASVHHGRTRRGRSGRGGLPRDGDRRVHDARHCVGRRPARGRDGAAGDARTHRRRSRLPAAQRRRRSHARAARRHLRAVGRRLGAERCARAHRTPGRAGSARSPHGARRRREAARPRPRRRRARQRRATRRGAAGAAGGL